MMPAVPIVQPGVEDVDPRVEPPFGEAPELKVCGAHETYTLQCCLGAGSFGRVFMCWAETARCQVAIKMIPGHSQYNRIASNEIRILSHISKNVELAAKAHLPSLREAFRTPCNSCFVFDLLGKNLHEVHRENNFRPFALRHVRVIAQQLLLALSQLKEWGIIHADLKPENILLANDSTKNFHVQLIDFGSSSFSAEVKFVRDPYIQSRYYRAPEILLGAPFSEKVDMWSLGCVLAELLLCWPLYPGSNEYDQMIH
uniref:Protein kinase domain-containing protein n=1 Tax=Eptatretus burgeri TaxID=7764 RepID=A0A8C4QX00_EPTBU